MGRHSEAIAATERALARDPYLTYLRVELTLDRLRSDSRFTELLRRVRLAS